MKRQLLRTLVALRDLLPERISGGLRAKRFRYTPRDVPPVPRTVGGEVRLYIAQANFAGQGYRWARAAESLPGVVAANLMLLRAPARFSSDFTVPLTVSRASSRWQKKHFASIVGGTTHVLIEASRPIFGALFEGDLRREVAALQEGGIRVGMISHGSEVRLPSRHAAAHPFSPFHVMDPSQVSSMEQVARSNQKLLSELGVPTFVSTPALMIEQPEATWLPVAIDTSEWSSAHVPLVREVPVVVHAPSREVIKRSDLIDAALSKLDGEGLISYRRIAGLPNSEIPAIFADADVLVDAVGTGNYGVAACEGMASGCVVVSYVDPQVARFVRSETGRDLPIVHTEPDQLEDTIRRVLGDRKRYQDLAADGLSFVAEFHDGARSAAALRSFLAT